MNLLAETALGGAAVSVIAGLLSMGYLGNGFFAIQLSVTLIVLCMGPLLKRAVQVIPKTVRYAFASVFGAVFVLPVFGALLLELFTGHRREDATPVDAIWRIFVILALWIGFAKVNETYIKPAIKEIPFLNRKFGSSLASAREQMVKDKQTQVLDGIKARLQPVVRRKKNAENVLETSAEELESTQSQVIKAERLLGKKETQLSEAVPEDVADLEDERDALQEMASNARKYLKTLEGQVENARQDMKESKEAIERLKVDWNKAQEMNSFTTFYR